jgi:5-methylcytosine-specific restriction endonuclease McrA
MKPHNVSWHEYLTEFSNDDPFENSHEYNTIRESIESEMNNIRIVHERCMPYLSESSKAVSNRKYPKQIIKEKTRVFFGSENFPPYSFRFQCLITGDQSKLIKIDDYPSYGILKSDAQNGGDFPYRKDIKNKLTVVKEYLDEQVASIRSRMNELYEMLGDVSMTIKLNMRDMWFIRYNEYLYSDEWKRIRNKVVESDGHCLNCQSKNNLQAHHIDYDNVGMEEQSDLLTLCRDCHKQIHSMTYNERLEMEQRCIEQRRFDFY